MRCGFVENLLGFHKLQKQQQQKKQKSFSRVFYFVVVPIRFTSNISINTFNNKYPKPVKKKKLKQKIKILRVLRTACLPHCKK